MSIRHEARFQVCQAIMNKHIVMHVTMFVAPDESTLLLLVILVSGISFADFYFEKLKLTQLFVFQTMFC